MMTSGFKWLVSSIYRKFLSSRTNSIFQELQWMQHFCTRNLKIVNDHGSQGRSRQQTGIQTEFTTRLCACIVDYPVVVVALSSLTTSLWGMFTGRPSPQHSIQSIQQQHRWTVPWFHFHTFVTTLALTSIGLRNSWDDFEQTNNYLEWLDVHPLEWRRDYSLDH